MSDWGTCDQCPAPATTVARDAIRKRQEPGDIWAEFLPHAEVKRGCAQHPVISVLRDVDGAALGEDE